MPVLFYGAVGSATLPASLFRMESLLLSGLLLPLELPPPTSPPPLAASWEGVGVAVVGDFCAGLSDGGAFFPISLWGIFTVLVEVTVWRFVL